MKMKVQSYSRESDPNLNVNLENKENDVNLISFQKHNVENSKSNDR